MIPSSETNETIRTYPDTYYQQHRNSILFSLVCALLSLPHVSVNLNKLLFLESHSRVAAHLLPWGVWIAAAYSTLHFYVEWRDHAKPHGQAIVNAVAEIRTELRSMSSHLQALTTLDATISRIDRAVEQVSQMSATGVFEVPTVIFKSKLSSAVGKRIQNIRNKVKETINSKHSDGSRRLNDAVEKDFAAGLKNLTLEIDNMVASQSGFSPASQAASFKSEAISTREAIEEFRSELQIILAEPRWVKEQINLIERWTAVRVWLIGLAPPLALWVIATLVFLDGQLGSPVLQLLFGDAALQASINTAGAVIP